MKAVALLSGGLDSTLAIEVVKRQGIEVLALNFFSPFCLCDKKGGCCFEAKRAADNLGVSVKRLFLGEEFLKMVKHPRYGYGKNLNPCIDCRILMFKKTKEFMKKVGAKFVITGEVLGQRPMSQHKRALRIIEQESGLEGLILRPLSAKLLKETIPEKQGWVRRQELLEFCGRRRTPQMQLAHYFGIHDYPCSSGGCLLTDPGFCRRLSDLMNYGIFNLENVELLKLGRHFRIEPYYKLIVGRNEEENKKLLHLRGEEDIVFEPYNIKGPLGLGRYSQRLFNGEYLKIISARILAHYFKISDEQDCGVRVLDKEENTLRVKKISPEKIEKWRV